MKSFYDYDVDNPTERQERYTTYPELSRFHMALQDELTDDEYQTYYESEKQLIKPTPVANNFQTRWI
ncbi:hypothetical protein [Adhaeribacter pallidiroseus]|uniref:Uncharacterized protein n=1 Tax=Adhaeribacter pallidiroseus TaxID=2072847 RepID=A0A369QKI6_9BACT|nr:hypothetical protein [Adhaeribacter pallidiroseus]RDC65433.1 hypothetical protein AHMF7616_04063 [Adhaeribacter pallidiroseus]